MKKLSRRHLRHHHHVPRGVDVYGVQSLGGQLGDDDPPMWPPQGMLDHCGLDPANVVRRPMIYIGHGVYVSPDLSEDEVAARKEQLDRDQAEADAADPRRVEARQLAERMRAEYMRSVRMNNSLIADLDRRTHAVSLRHRVARRRSPSRRRRATASAKTIGGDPDPEPDALVAVDVIWTEPTAIFTATIAVPRRDVADALIELREELAVKGGELVHARVVRGGAA